MRVLELFSGTHSVGKVAHSLGWEVVSVDRDLNGECPFNSGYKSDIHIKEDIMTWNYKEYPKGHFDLVTASPVCLWWSNLRYSWIGKKSPKIHPTEIVTRQHLDDQIDLYGKPMVDKVIEIIEYFDPTHWWIENPQTGRMKYYIEEKYPQYNTFYDVDYCKYSDFGYKKRTRFWTNVEDFKALKCNKDCLYINDDGKHKVMIGRADTSNVLLRYRIPQKLIEELFISIISY